MSRGELKADAKRAMKEAAVSPYVVTVIMGVILLILGSVQFFLDLWEEFMAEGIIESSANVVLAFGISSAVFYFVNLILSTILQFGYQSYCLKVAARNQNMSYGDLFSAVKYLLKAIGLVLMVSIFTLLWSLLFIIPGIIAACRYSQAVFIMAENPNKGIMECIRESKEMMAGHKWEWFVLGLSFILWDILGVFTCFLAFIYVTPYTTVTLANYYYALKGNSADFTAWEQAY
ncbi:MAG: DUF975 family protein [Lacrimispora sp.]|uniref:DUF975 family protein n=1 Tax=Lacrimispora sp. TaxID=2719234 RepID=UPI0039E3A133